MGKNGEDDDALETTLKKNDDVDVDDAKRRQGRRRRTVLLTIGKSDENFESRARAVTTTGRKDDFCGKKGNGPPRFAKTTSATKSVPAWKGFYCFKKHQSLELLKRHLEKERHEETHEACCEHCGKMCKTYFRLREHLVGATASQKCKEAFESQGGCRKCLRIVGKDNDKKIHACAFNSCGSNSSSNSNTNRREERENASHVAIDCEMIATTKSDKTLAKVCVVNGLDESILMETVVKFRSEEEGEEEDDDVKVLDYRTEITGLTARDWETTTKALPTFSEAREEVLACLAGLHENTPEAWKGKPHKLIVHDARHDLEALQITEEDVRDLDERIRDTSTYVPLQKEKGKRVKLKKLVEQFLVGPDANDNDDTLLRDFQGQTHSPYLDALASLRLYRGCRDNCVHFQSVRKGPREEEENIEYIKTVNKEEKKIGEKKEEEEEEKHTSWVCWCEDLMP